MRARIPFSYECTVLTGSGKRADRTYREILEVDVPEVSASEAPPVLRQRGWRDVGFHHADPADPALARRRTGILYHPVRIDREDEEEVRAERLADEAWAVRLLSDVPAVAGSEETRTKGPPRPETVQYGYRDRTIEAMRKVGASLLSVDGVLHRAVGEPVLSAVVVKSWDRRAQRAERSLALKELPRVDEAGMDEVFSLAEVEAALERARMNRRHEGFAGEPLLPEFEVLDPSLLLPVDPSRALAAAARSALVSASYELASLDRASVLAWDDLRRAAGRDPGLRWDEERPPVVDDDLASALAEMAASLERSGRLAHAAEKARSSLLVHALRMEAGGLLLANDDADALRMAL